MVNQVLLYELNEVPWEVWDRYIEVRPQSHQVCNCESPSVPRNIPTHETKMLWRHRQSIYFLRCGGCWAGNVVQCSLELFRTGTRTCASAVSFTLFLLRFATPISRALDWFRRSDRNGLRA